MKTLGIALNMLKKATCYHTNFDPWKKLCSIFPSEQNQKHFHFFD